MLRDLQVRIARQGEDDAVIAGVTREPVDQRELQALAVKHLRPGEIPRRAGDAYDRHDGGTAARSDRRMATRYCDCGSERRSSASSPRIPSPQSCSAMRTK